MAFTTRFFGPTNHRGARIRVTCPCGQTVWHPWDYAASTSENHEMAVIRAGLRRRDSVGLDEAHTIDVALFTLPDTNREAYAADILWHETTPKRDACVRYRRFAHPRAMLDRAKVAS